MNRSLAPGTDRASGAAGLDAIQVSGLTADSRAVQPGFLFAALPGVTVNGVDFIPDAVRRGAAAVLAPRGTAQTLGALSLPVIEDAQPRQRFARMAAAFYGAQPEIVVAVTGTSGKSSTVTFARQIWHTLGLKAASLGTLGIESDAVTRYSGLTTADPVALHADLAELAKAGVTHAAMEASSHGLDQYRLDGVRIAVAGFTSFGRDHLDYHESPEAYFAAKTRLFTEVLQPDGTAVLNADIPEFARLDALTRDAGRKAISYGRQGADIKIAKQRATMAGQSATLEVFGASYDIALPLAGGFQLSNALCALGMVLAAGAETAPAVAALDRLQGVRGRLERVGRLANGAAIYVDYAHKPDALETVLIALRAHTPGKLAEVFGCGGNRDRGKRPVMGEIATRLADRVIVTDDNPRREDPATIRAEIMAGARGAIEIADRAEAIAAGIAGLGSGDVLIIAGKGHEQGQIVGDTVRPFDDAAVAREIMAGGRR